MIGGARSIFRGGPNVDGYVLAKEPSEAVNEAPINDVPVLMGHNGDEGDVRRPISNVISRSELEQHAKQVYGAAAPKLLGLYLSSSNDPGRAWRASGHDRVMFGEYDWAYRRTAHARSPVYTYDFTHVMPGYTAKDWGSFHNSEIPYWTENLDRLAARPWTKADREISATMSAYWINFIKTGNPNGSGLAEWKPCSTSAATVMELGDHPHMRPIAGASATDFFKEFYGTH